MADTLAPVVTDAAIPKKASKAKTAKKPRAQATHPKTADMVNNAIKSLKERGGSSLQAIKKYVTANYKVDAEKLSPFIKKYLKAAVTSGALVQTKGKGASGSFKLPNKDKAEKAPAKPKVAKKPAGPAQEPAKKPKSLTAKKAPAAKKAIAVKKHVSPKKPNSPSKAKKVAKAPAASKKPKPKKVVKPKSFPKKAAAKKK